MARDAHWLAKRLFQPRQKFRPEKNPIWSPSLSFIFTKSGRVHTWARLVREKKQLAGGDANHGVESETAECSCRGMKRNISNETGINLRRHLSYQPRWLFMFYPCILRVCLYVELGLSNTPPPLQSPSHLTLEIPYLFVSSPNFADCLPVC